MKMRCVWEDPLWLCRQVVGSTNRAGRWLSVVLLTGCGVGLSGCGPHNFANENDRLRADKLKLQQQVQTLKHRLNLRAGELTALQQRVDQGRHPVAGTTPPQLAKLKLGRYSAAVDTDDDGRDDTVRVYLETLDGQGRFTPVSGKASLQVVAVRGDQPPKVLAQRTYDPETFSDAYRSGLTGTHYTLEVPLPDKLPRSKIDATAVVTLIQGANGVKFTAQKALQIVRTP